MSPAPVPLPPIRSRSDLLAAVGYLLGYQPQPGHLVVIAIKDTKLILALAVDAADLHDDALREATAHMVTHLRHHRAQAVLVAYGDPQLIGAAAATTLAALHATGIDVLDALRVAAGRYFCLRCHHCVDPHGQPVDLTASPVSAAAVYAGLVALPDRHTLQQHFAPYPGAQAARTRRALRRARHRHPQPSHTGKPSTADEYTRAGMRAVDDALATHQHPLDDDTAADLLLYLRQYPIRDYAWSRTTEDHQALWTDLMRRAPDHIAAPPATLLAYCALLDGDGTVANIALQRALSAEPRYDLARLLIQIINRGIPPWRLRQIMNEATTPPTAPPAA